MRLCQREVEEDESGGSGGTQAEQERFEWGWGDETTLHHRVVSTRWRTPPSDRE